MKLLTNVQVWQCERCLRKVIAQDDPLICGCGWTGQGQEELMIARQHRDRATPTPVAELAPLLVVNR